ncbi:MAG: hypothetical protein IPF94_13780 [Betaproteobacteria bacterium]|nr:hypothetical protein [Betaproteobacteria bacterium]
MDGTPGWPSTPAVLPKTGDDTLTEYSTQNMVMAYNDIPGQGSSLQADFRADDADEGGHRRHPVPLWPEPGAQRR